jgi:hypothetical protein
MRYVWIDHVADHNEWAFMSDDTRQAWELIYDRRTGICYSVPMHMSLEGWATTNIREWNGL